MDTTDLRAAVAQELSVAIDRVRRVEVWANCLFAVVSGIGGRFLSKKIMNLKPEPITWVIKANMRRQERKFWVARITGLCPKYGFKRDFLNPEDVEWGKYGMKEARFILDRPGFFQDSDGDYFKVVRIRREGGVELEVSMCSSLEIKEVLKKVEQKRALLRVAS